MNWRLKIAAKMVLSRVPVSLRTWQRLHLFRAGHMDDEAKARHTFMCHFAATGWPDLKDKTMLELGPGNGLLSAKFARELGASYCWLVDARQISNTLTIDNGVYLTQGLQSLRTLKSESVDFIFSHAVLEHVRLREFSELMGELLRILKPSGIASHQIDFADHLGHGLNNLRFTESQWESDAMANSGFYTNRLTWPQMRRIFEQCGFSVHVHEVTEWPSLPTPQSKMAEPFRSMPASDFAIMSLGAVLNRAGQYHQQIDGKQQQR